VSTAVAVALIVFGVSIVGGGAYAAVKGLRAWRAFRRFRRTAETAMAHVTEVLAELERRTAAVDEHVARLERAKTQLQQTLAEARIVAGAAAEVYASYRRVRMFIPL
jgi:hypothetical protein